MSLGGAKIFRSPETDNKLYVKFTCKVCGHTFPRQLKRIYFHAPTLGWMIEKDTAEMTEPVIPQPIECTRCKAVNLAELSAYDQVMTRMAALLNSKLTSIRPNDLIQVVTFCFGGEAIHPLQAIRKYQKMVEDDPEHYPNRFLYARALRMVGRWQEAETQYQLILEQVPNLLEAWYGMAMLAYAGGHKRAARQALQELILHAAQSRDPWHAGMEKEACEILTRERPFESLLVDLVQVDDSPAPMKKKTNQKGRHKKRK